MNWLFVKPIDDEKIKEVERELEVVFPRSFVNCVRVNNGGSPESHTTYDLDNRKEQEFGELFDFNASGEGLSITDAHKILMNEHGLPKEMIPFADDPSGNFLCFDYRNVKNGEPIIVLYDHEYEYNPGDEQVSLDKVADSFSDFLSMLYELED
ncbi:SMI1/KNR4 family protein [Mechercharimyces sp. CAU 1602]|uniref:SMI1/KNR4 family protein n=1 Tax=Mechercharimyces sp. CAU 1602 TaxID=2973933 RepID=UPI002162C542|nr:SMI1/KNR4 family protein [Mechercharimyces sp. CAU 1602]MCS1350753.1 SMI1/KNR4 family protein [Mechercharimyces sp. CAU 1602]